MASEIEFVMWEIRDGTIRAETQLVTIQNLGCSICGLNYEEHVNDDHYWHTNFGTHLLDKGSNSKFTTICGRKFFGQLSSTGLGGVDKVDCPICREFLKDKRFTLS
jgi:hypothetical protein